MSKTKHLHVLSNIIHIYDIYMPKHSTSRILLICNFFPSIPNHKNRNTLCVTIAFFLSLHRLIRQSHIYCSQTYMVAKGMFSGDYNYAMRESYELIIVQRTPFYLHV